MGRSASVPSGSGEAAEDGESKSARARAVGRGPGVLLEKEEEGIKGRDFEGRGGGGE